MTATTHEDLHSPQLPQDSSAQHRPTSLWMWIALIVAMFAGALLWLRHSNQEDVAPAPVGERMLPAPEQPAVTDAAALPRARQPRLLLRGRPRRQCAIVKPARWPATACPPTPPPRCVAACRAA